MKNTFKKGLAFLLAVIMLASFAPYAMAQETESGAETSTESYMEGANTVGDLIIQESEEFADDAAVPEGYGAISAATVSGNKVTVSYHTQRDAKLVAAVYNDDGSQLIASGVLEVLAAEESQEETQATVAVNIAEMPQNYLLKVFLLDDAANAPLCDNYVDDTHTAAYLEYMSKDVYDFDSEQVINLDEKDFTNFMVLADGVYFITGTSTVNVLESADYENMAFVFSNIDEQISSLSVGDLFYYENKAAEKMEVIKVRTISVDGTTATIASDAVEFDDFFAHIRIESAYYTEPEQITTMSSRATNLNDSYTFYSGSFELTWKKQKNSNKLDLEAKLTTKKGLCDNEISSETDAEEDENRETVIKVTGDVELKANINIYLSDGYKKVEFSVDGEAGITIDFQREFEKKVKLCDPHFSFYKILNVGVKLEFKFKANVKLEISGKLTFRAGAAWIKGHGFNNISEWPHFDPEVKVEGTIQVGFVITPNFNLISEYLMTGRIPIDVYAKVTGTLDSPWDDKVHTCVACIDGTISLNFEIKAELVFFEDVKTFWGKELEEKFSTDPFKIEIEITKFYFSVDHLEFGLGRCPYRNNFTFGSYPQSKVEDSATLSALNAQTLSWKSYGYYSGNGSYGSMTAKDYMRYADVSYNGNKYRAVTFDTYRPYWTEDPSTTSAGTYQDDNGYSPNTVYWFKYEPLEWRVLDPTTGYIMCETIIDSQPYSNTIYSGGKDANNYTGYWNDEAKTNYANDWATSSLREWLNDDFYNTAFTSSEKSKIKQTTLDNSSAYTSNKNTYADTTDKIFIPSYSDMLNTSYGFNSSSSNYDTARQAQGSDYAKCQGLYVYNSSSSAYDGNSSWRLRSPGDNSFGTSGVIHGGYVEYSINNSGYGIRPALRISNLPSKISESIAENSAEVILCADGSSQTALEPQGGSSAAAKIEISATGCLPGEMYAVLHIADYSEGFTLTADNLMFIDQLRADDDGALSLSFTPKETSETAKTVIIGAFGEGGDTQEKDPSTLPPVEDHTVSFYVDGELYHSKTYAYKAAITQPDAPTKPGHKFIGWSPEVPASMPARDLVFTAQFEEDHVHSYNTLAYYQTAHPHYAVYRCECGEEQTSTVTGYMGSCAICNPHTHAYNTLAYYQTAHPHYAVYRCECGEEQVSDETKFIESCERCNPADETEPEFVSIEIEKMPSQLEFTYKSAVSSAGLQVVGIDANGERYDITDKIEITGFDTNKPVGTKQATVSYTPIGADDPLTATFTYTVKYTWWQWIIRILLLGFLWY